MPGQILPSEVVHQKIVRCECEVQNTALEIFGIQQDKSGGSDDRGAKWGYQQANKGLAVQNSDSRGQIAQDLKKDG